MVFQPNMNEKYVQVNVIRLGFYPSLVKFYMYYNYYECVNDDQRYHIYVIGSIIFKI